MKIRRAEQKDLHFIVEIEGLCFPEETTFPPGMFVYLIRYAAALVASESDDKVVGFVMGYISGRGGAFYTLDVHPTFRKKGVGSMLIQALEEELHALGAKAIRLEAALDNPEAMNLYRKAGYRGRELVRNYYGRGKDAVRMWKELDVDGLI
jgi:[ribosomal protein S18]-alanine N-acetyltransferase